MTKKENNQIHYANEKSWKQVKKIPGEYINFHKVAIGNDDMGRYLWTAFYGSELMGFVNIIESHVGYVKACSILDSYTKPHLRRKGIRTELQKKLTAEYDLIQTTHANPEAERFLKKEGFKFNQDFGGWIWVKPKKRGRKPKGKK